jgi:hypothetical protein
MLALALAGALFGALAAALLFHLAGYLDGHPSRGRLMLLMLVGGWPMTFVGTFLNIAVATAADAVLSGRPRPTVGEALAMARAKAGQIALWSLLAAGVGQLLSQLGERLRSAAASRSGCSAARGRS